MLDSAIRALKTSASFVDDKLPQKIAFRAAGRSTAYVAKDLKVSLREGNLPLVLAKIGTELMKLLYEYPSNAAYTLGIILPGGSKVFYPSLATETEDPTIHIKATYNFANRHMPYIFQGVDFEDLIDEDDDVQTMQFLDLPPETRNMIYEIILLQIAGNRTGGGMLRRQPALSCTCRTVNKEMMSPVWQKYGWLVCR